MLDDRLPAVRAAALGRVAGPGEPHLADRGGLVVQHGAGLEDERRVELADLAEQHDVRVRVVDGVGALVDVAGRVRAGAAGPRGGGRRERGGCTAVLAPELAGADVLALGVHQQVRVADLDADQVRVARVHVEVEDDLAVRGQHVADVVHVHVEQRLAAEDQRHHQRRRQQRHRRAQRRARARAPPLARVPVAVRRAAAATAPRTRSVGRAAGVARARRARRRQQRRALVVGLELVGQAAGALGAAGDAQVARGAGRVRVRRQTRLAAGGAARAAGVAGRRVAAAVGGEEGVWVEDGGVRRATVAADVVVVQRGAAAVDAHGAGARAVGGRRRRGGLAVAGIAVERAVGVGELHALLAHDAVVAFRVVARAVRVDDLAGHRGGARGTGVVAMGGWPRQGLGRVRLVNERFLRVGRVRLVDGAGYLGLEDVGLGVS